MNPFWPLTETFFGLVISFWIIRLLKTNDPVATVGKFSLLNNQTMFDSKCETNETETEGLDGYTQNGELRRLFEMDFDDADDNDDDDDY